MTNRADILEGPVPSTAPTLEERNESYAPPHFDTQGGRLGETPILWEFRMAYAWSEQFEEEYPDWDQCCTCWVFAVSEGEARRKVWERFKQSMGVMPEAIASCYPKRFRIQRDEEIDARLASGIAARSDETPTAAQPEARARPDAQPQSGEE